MTMEHLEVTKGHVTANLFFIQPDSKWEWPRVDIGHFMLAYGLSQKFFPGVVAWTHGPVDAKQMLFIKWESLYNGSGLWRQYQIYVQMNDPFLEVEAVEAGVDGDALVELAYGQHRVGDDAFHVVVFAEVLGFLISRRGYNDAAVEVALVVWKGVPQIVAAVYADGYRFNKHVASLQSG